jgi:Methylase involved in ubiquinone/menaquinone biosynthesis
MDPECIFILRSGLPRQGPGSDECTEKAYRMLSGLPGHPDILDIGCGTGAQTLVLAELSGGIVDAVDIYLPYLKELERKAKEAGFSGRILPHPASMSSLPVPPGSYDLIWSEGAIYLMGFREGLEYWSRFVRDGGYIVVTGVSWLTGAQSYEARSYWDREYPGMRTVPENVGIIRSLGLYPVGTFVLPESAWWETYYTPLGARVEQMRAEYRDDPDMCAMLDGVDTEIAMYRNHSGEYGSVFYLMQKR